MAIYQVFCTFTGEGVGCFSGKEKAEKFLSEIQELTKGIQMIGGTLLLSPLSEHFCIKETELDIETAQTLFDKIKKMKEQADEEFSNSDDEEDDEY